jgi:hypothetical protein
MIILEPGRPDGLVVTCLKCGYARSARRTGSDRVEPAECPACHYLGWRESAPVPVSHDESPGGRS